MLTLTITLDSLAFYIVIADILCLLFYILYIKHKARQLAKANREITDFICDYFRNSGAEVGVTCIKQPDSSRRFLVLIESEPLKRFRYSNILESNLINHIYKTTGQMVEKIYWRFPIQLSKETVLAYDGDGEEAIYTQEQAKLQEQSSYGVSEVTWDEFEKIDQNKK